MKRIAAWLCAALIRLVGATLRMEIVDAGGILNKPDHPPVIIAFWHNRIATAAIFWRRYCHPRRALVFISRSRDGQVITDIARYFKIEAARGSSSKHGIAAAMAALRVSDDPRLDLVITPDGPRGPRCVIQPGLLRLSQATNRPIVTVTVHLKWKLELKSWDHFQVPLPFSRAQLITGTPVQVPRTVSEDEWEQIQAELKKALDGADPFASSKF